MPNTLLAIKDGIFLMKLKKYILNHGTEHDLQMEYLRENNIDDLKIYLMETVDYNL